MGAAGEPETVAGASTSRAPGSRVLVASNRGPVSYSFDDRGDLRVKRGGGGVVSALRALSGQADVLWVCAALSDADRAAARLGAGLLPIDGALPVQSSAPPDDGNGSAVRMLDIPPEVFHRAYNGVANSTLWFIHHMLYDTPNRPGFGLAFEQEWDAFRAYNQEFAHALAAANDHAAASGPTGRRQRRALIQDYHLCLAPRMLAERRPDLAIAHFSHTPWAPPDYFRILPDEVGRAVLAGILGADHAGFLSRRWARAFLDCCEQVLGAQVDHDRSLVTYRGHVTGVGVHPLGVDAAELRARASQPDVTERATVLAKSVGDRRLIVRIDRTELSKNIVRGLLAYRELLIRYPRWRGRVVHLALAYPSRHDLPEYREYTATVQRVARDIRQELGTPDWDPLIMAVEDDYARSLAAYRLADVLLVNPIRDGMNLVAKEGPLLAERGCVLVLSREAGAADELSEAAIMVNPFDVAGTAEALHRALSLEDSEREARSARLADICAVHPPSEWLASQLAALGGLASAASG